MRVDFIKSKASVLLDLVRGLAALLVMTEHWRNIFFVDYFQIAQHRTLFALPYLLTSTGHQAVVIFFVLSGYLISGSIFRSLKRNNWNWGLYLTPRLLRLWIVLIPGLLLCALWDTIGIQSHMAPLLYSGGIGNHMMPDVTAVRSVKIFFENLGFLQMILAPTYGSDGVLWSLSSEFWYYILFPLGLFVVLPKVPVRARLICGVLFGVTAWFVGTFVLTGFPIWLLGTVLALLPVPKLSNWFRIVVSCLFVVVYFVSAKIGAIHVVVDHLSPTALDYLLGLATLLFLWVLLSASNPSENTAGEKGARELSRFSYTLYVCHTPLLVLLAAALVGDHRWTPSPVHILIASGVLVLLIAYSYGLAYVTEFRTDQVRRFLEAKFFSKQKRELVAATSGAAK